MARTPNIGGSQSVSAEDFNARVKRLLAEKPDVEAVAKPQRPRRQFNRDQKPKG